MRKRVTVKLSRAQTLIVAFAALGLTIFGVATIVPMMGLFGIIWTILAASISVYYFYMAFGKRYVGPEIHIEDETNSSADMTSRLQQLEALHAQKLITDEEYEKKRQELLRSL